MKTNHLIPLAFNKNDETSETVACKGNAKNVDKKTLQEQGQKKIQSHITV